MSTRINRITLFKLLDPAGQKRLVKAYQELAKTHSRVSQVIPGPLPSGVTVADNAFQDGKPYILYVSAGIVLDDPRAQGYTVAAKTEFASLDDMRFYDEQCQAHAALKETAKAAGVAEKPLTVYFGGEPALMTPHAK